MTYKRPTMQAFRHRLAEAEALPQLALLGIISGLFTGAIIIAFRILATLPFNGLLMEGDTDDITRLPWVVRLVLPIIGTLLIAWLFSTFKPAQRQVGVAHVMERLAANQGRLPGMNVIAQFFGALIAIASGNSVGREGPSIHLGAAGSSLIGQWLKLPNNSLRTLTGCGCAAAIAAGFNTPIAGVILTMEVIMLEYNFSSFTPVILASVTAAILSSLVFGQSPAFEVPMLTFSAPAEFPLIILLGIATGLLAFLFCKLILKVQQFPVQSSFIRFGIAGLLTGIVATVIPQVMGIGYETVNQILLGQLPLLFMMAILLSKLIVTATAIGMGIPGGLIGPTLVMGVTAGAITGQIAEHYFILESGSDFYALLGMGAMLAAVLQAPLAALMTVLELTRNSHLILPALLAIITATLVCRQLSGLPGIFIAILQQKGQDHQASPLKQTLQRVGVASLMQRHTTLLNRISSIEQCEQAIREQPHWILVKEQKGIQQILLAADLSHALSQKDLTTESPELDLLIIPGERHEIQVIDISATLLEAHHLMTRGNLDFICVTVQKKSGQRILGIITRQSVEAYYR